LVNTAHTDGCTDIADVTFIGFDTIETNTPQTDAPAYIQHFYTGAITPE
jgi:hypothetical protein